MKNAKQISRLSSLFNANRNQAVSTPTKDALALAFFFLLMVSLGVPSQAQNKRTPYVPPPAPRQAPAPAPRPAPAPVPRPSPAPAPRPAPAPAPAPAPRPAPAPIQQTPSVPQRPAPSVPQHQALPVPPQKVPSVQQNQEPARTSPAVSHASPSGTNQAASRPAASGGAVASSGRSARSAAPPAYKAPDSSAVARKTPTGAMALTKSGSQSTLQQVNATRASLSGVNRKPLPSGDVTVHPNGRLTLEASGGRKFGLRSNGTISSYRDREKSVSFDQRGKVSSLRTANMSVRRDANGVRTIESRRADNSRVVSTGRHTGFVERNVVVGNRTYIQRTTIVNERITTNTFVAYNYGGITLTHFVAPVFYAPAFYGWTFYPWAVPVHFGFGWFGAPWYVGPDPFFTAYPVYPGAAFWLTDYMLGETLSAAYRMREDALLSEALDAKLAADEAALDDESDMLRASATTPITQELKDQIAQEVKQQLEYDNAAAGNPTHETKYDELPTVLGQANHVFIVSSNLEVTTDDMQECGLQAGDLLRLVAPPANGAAIVGLRVASSKQMDCPAGVTVAVSLQDLQEMQNSFRSHVESGLASLSADQGRGGIPVAPPDAVAAPPRPTLAGLAPMPASDMLAALDEQRQQADQAEAQIAGASF